MHSTLDTSLFMSDKLALEMIVCLNASKITAATIYPNAGIASHGSVRSG